MTSFKFQLRISFSFYFGLSYNLFGVLWVVNVTLRSFEISCDLEGHIYIWGQWQGQCIFFLYRLISQIHNPANSWPHHFKFQTIVGDKRNFRFWRYYVINIFKLEYLRYLLSHADQTGFGQRWMTVYFLKNIFYVTSGLVDMPSLKFQLRISFLFYVGFSHNLVKEIWVGHTTLRSYKISCEIEGHVDLWSQLKGQCIFFLYRLICQFITQSILDRITPNF